MSSRGALGAPSQKHRSQNVNSVYSGKNTAASKASGPSKHGGLQALGKTSTIVRRMPKPATLPSLKAEHGQDPQVCLVPQGGQGWSKSTDQTLNAECKGSGTSDVSAAGAPDLRPNWAKQPSGAGGGSGASTDAAQQQQAQNAMLSSAQQQQQQAPSQQQSVASSTSADVTNTNTAEYPTLAASAAAAKTSSAVGGGVDASQKGQRGSPLPNQVPDAIVPLPPVPQPQPAGYIGASGPRIVDRKLPERYYGGPEVSQRQTGQKYNFLQKMAKLSMDAKEQQSQTAGLTNSSNKLSSGSEKERASSHPGQAMVGQSSSAGQTAGGATSASLLATSTPTAQTLVGGAEGSGEVAATTTQEDVNLHQHQELKHPSSGHQGYRQVQQQQQHHYGQQQPPQQHQQLHAQQQKYYNVQQTGQPHQLHHAAPDSDSSSTAHLGGMMKKTPLLQHPPPPHLHHQQPSMGEYTVAGGGMEERGGNHPQQHASSLPPSSHRGGGGNVSAQFENHPLAAGVQQSGHGDIGYSTGHYQRHHGGYDERALSTEGTGNTHHPHSSLGYDYRHAPAAHHHSYDESGVPPQSASIIGYSGSGANDAVAYRCGDDMTGGGDEHGGYMSGSYDGSKDNKHHHWSGGGGDESQGGASDGGSMMTQHHQGQSQPPPKYSVRQPLLPQPPAHQMSRYANRPQTAQDDSGWYGFDSVQRVSSGGGRRGGGGSGDTSTPPLYSAQSSGGNNVGWYGSGGGGVSNNTSSATYPPSLLSLDGGVMDAYESGNGGGRFNQSGGSQRYGQMAQQQQHHGGGSRSRNTASVSSSYGGMDDNSRYVEVTGAQSALKIKSTRRGGHSVTEPSSENDNGGGTYLRDFFDNDPSDNDRQKSFWDRSSNSGGTTIGYATRLSNNNIGASGPAARSAEQQYKLASKSFDQSQPQPQQQQPQFRMLKRNDEKSAEYFAHYATVATTDGSNGLEATVAESGEEIYSFSQGSGPSTKKKQPQQKSGGGARKTSVSGLTAVNGSEEVATDGLTFYNNGGQQRAAHQQQNGKFNRAPGGGKSSAQQQSKAMESGNDGAKSADVSDIVQTAPPADNIWEKRKEEQRQSAERKTQQAKQSRQFDFHFPSMSDAAKFDSTTNAEADSVTRGNGARSGGRFQDVRFDQPASANLYDNNRQQQVGRQSNRQHGYASSDWNPPEPNAESHWDELAVSTPTVTLAPERRGGSRGNGVDEEPQFGGDLFPGDTNNAGGGMRREFINSKNRLGAGKSGLSLSRGGRGGTAGALAAASSGKSGGTKVTSGSGRERRQPKSGGTDRGGSRSDGQRSSRRTATSPSTEERQRGGDASRKPRGGGGGSEVLAQSTKPKTSGEINAKDNFSNMGEFHAEDYKMGSDNAKSNDIGGAKSSRTNGREAKQSSNRRGGQRRGTSGQNESTTRQRGSGGGRQSRNGGGTSISGGGVFIGRNWRPTQSDGNGAGSSVAEPLSTELNGCGGAASEIVNAEQHSPSTDVPFLEDGVLPPPPPLEAGEQTEYGSNINIGGARQQQRALTARNGNGAATPQQQQRRRGASSRASSNVQSRSGGASRFMQRHANSKPPRYKDKVNGHHQAMTANAEQQQADAAGQRNHQHLGDRANQLKSPVISDGGAEEWETASESSDFFAERSGRATVEDDVPQRPSMNDGGGSSGQPPLQRVFSERDLKRNTNSNRSAGSNRRDQPSTANGEHLSNGNIAIGQKRSAGQKNVKPASHTFQSSAASATRSNNNSNHRRNSNNVNNTASSVDRSTSEGGAAPSMMKNARDSRRGAGVINSSPFAVRNGLAGVDINDASVVVIDHQPDRLHHRGRSADGGSASDGSGDFEEVLSKRAKRQRLQQLEEERKRAEQERVRQERLAARRAKQLARRAEKQSAAAAKKAAALAAKEARKQHQQVISTTVTEAVVAAVTNDCSLKNGDDFAVFTTGSQSPPQHSFNASPVVVDVASCEKSNDVSNRFGSQPAMVSGGESTVVSSTTTTAYINGSCNNKSSSISVTTGFDSIAQTSAVWSNTSTDNPSDPSASATFASSNYGTVIPSPIARPVPKNAATTAVEAKQYSASEANANFDFTFDASPLKSTDAGSQSVKVTAESSSAKVSQCSPAASGDEKVNCITSTSITSGVAGLLISKASVSSSASKTAENSDDHAQLQKKLDKVKDFWPAGADAAVNSSTATTPVTGTTTSTASQQRPSSFNVAKVKPQQQQSVANVASNVSTTGAVDPAVFSNSYTSKIMTTNPQSPIASAVFGNALFTLGGLPPTQPAAASQQLGASYSIMLSSGEFVAKSMMAAAPPHHSTNSPPHFPMGNNGTSRAGSRPNSFFDQSSQQPPHALIVAHNPQQNQPSNTPWSNGGFEFLSGFGATPPPPPMSAPTPCNVTVGRSSVPPPPLMPEFHGSNGGPPLHHPHSHFMPQQQQQRGTETAKNGGILTMSGPPPHFPPPFAATAMQHPPPSGMGYHHPNGVFTPPTSGIMPPPPIGRPPSAHQQSSQSAVAAAQNGGIGMPPMHHRFGAPPPPPHHMPPPPPPGIQFMPPTIDCWSAPPPPPAINALNGGTTTPRNCPSAAIGHHNANPTMAAFFAAAAATRDAAAPDAGREGASQHQAFPSHNHQHRMNGFGVPSMMTMPPTACSGGTRQPMGTAPFPPSMRFAGGDASLAFNNRLPQQQQFYQQPPSRNGVTKTMDSRKSEFGSSSTGGVSQENTISATKNGDTNRNASNVTPNDGTTAEKTVKVEATVENGGGEAKKMVNKMNGNIDAGEAPLAAAKKPSAVTTSATTAIKTIAASSNNNGGGGEYGLFDLNNLKLAASAGGSATAATS